MPGRRIWLGVGIAGTVVLLAAVAASRYWSGAASAEHWESQIAAYEDADRSSPPEPGAIVFTGSSSIRMWKTLEQDMAPYRVLNRGFGGAHLDHVNTFASRIVAPYEASAIVLYAGDNDIAAGKDAARVASDFDRFTSLVRAGGSRAPILFVAIKPSRLRFEAWPAMAEANQAISAKCAADPSLHYVDIASPMLAAAKPGKPPPSELFIIDGLHLSAEGYAMWTEIVRAAIDLALGEPAGR